MKKLIGFVKQEAVLTISVFLAAASMFVVTPDEEYLSYIDFRTLALLFSLMMIIAGFRKIGFFDVIAEKMLKITTNAAGTTAVLVFICFFFSMIITNDVALITFVPLSITIFNHTDEGIKKRWLAVCVIMQTVAANLGSMLTPIGNPQNLYLYEKLVLSDSGKGFTDFIEIMLPYSVVSLMMLIIWLAALRFEKGNDVIFAADDREHKKIKQSDMEYMIAFSLLFFLSLLTVMHKIHFLLLFLLVLLYTFLRGRSILCMVDYSLLGTFTALFIFIGNLGRINFVADVFSSVIEEHEIITSVFASQIMSNVPAAVLLEKFTDNIPALIIGTNLGGLGTRIASMASLISFKLYSAEVKGKTGRYMAGFTMANVIFLICLLSVSFVIR